MSARPEARAAYRRMQPVDVDAVVAIEVTVYSHPWTTGNFTDSLSAGYECWVQEEAGEMVAYAVMMVAAGEAHLLNLSVAAPHQRRGHGKDFVRFLAGVARQGGAERLYLEVRPSNLAARGLYQRMGFSQIGMRRGYYPAIGGREDALVMELVI